MIGYMLFRGASAAASSAHKRKPAKRIRIKPGTWVVIIAGCCCGMLINPWSGALILMGVLIVLAILAGNARKVKTPGHPSKAEIERRHAEMLIRMAEYMAANDPVSKRIVARARAQRMQHS